VVNDEVIISLEGGAEIVAVITRESAEKMGLSDGKEVYAIIKASSVMIGID
jgi:molybdate transport system regulatory protein